MGAITALSNLAFRDYVMDGVPASGANNPTKSDIRALFAAIEAALGIQTATYASVYGVKADGIEKTAPCTIANGSNALFVNGGSFSSLDVGKLIIIPAIGSAGLHLTTTILAVVDNQNILLAANASAALTASSRKIRYGTDDTTAIQAAITAARNLPATLWFIAGMSMHSGMIEWGYKNLHVRFLDDNFKFLYTGAGTTAHSWNGIANYPASQGATGLSFGSPNCKPLLCGHPRGTTTYAGLIDNSHFGAIHVRPRDATQGLWMQDNGIVGASSVCMVIETRTSNNVDGAMEWQPNSGLNATKAVACVFPNLTVEGCGANSAFGAVLTGCINNNFIGGTVESNLHGGISEDSTSARNTFINIDVESNVTTEWLIAGKHPTLINCTGAVVASTFNSTGAIILGGTFQMVANNDNTLWSANTEWFTSFTNNGTHTTILNPQGDAAATALEAATSILGNKNINTDNGNILQIGSHQVTSTTGSGALVALQNSPGFTGTPFAPTAAVDTSTTQIASTAFVLGQAASATPLVDGTAAAGTSTRFARGDHVHPTDTSRAATASPTFTGTVTAPLIAGGSGAASALVLESTSGAGTSDVITFKTGSQIQRGQLNTSGAWAFGPSSPPTGGSFVPLVNISSNASGAINYAGTGAAAQALIIGPDANNSALAFQNYGAQCVFQAFTAAGTAASKTATASGTNFFNIQGFGWDGVEWGSGGVQSPNARIAITAAENQAAGAHGSKITFGTTPTGSTTFAVAATVQASGCFSIGTGADRGVGNLSLQGTLFVGTFTVATLPSGVAAGNTAYATNLRVFNGAGVQEGAAAGTGGAVQYNGSAWKIAGTNVTAVA